MIIKLRATASGQPGRGVLSVHGWKGGQTALEITVRRSQDSRFLGGDGTWSSMPVWHALQGLALVEDVLTGEVGPWLVDPLLHDHRMAHEMQMRDGVVSDKGVVSISGTILSSHAGGNLQGGEGPATSVTHPPEPASPEEPPTDLPQEPELPEPIFADPDDLTKRPEPPRPWWPWAVLAACVALAALVGGYIYWGQEAPSVAPDMQGDLAQCSGQALKQNSDDLAFIQGCLKTKPNGEQVLEVIARAKEAGRCAVVQRLYAHQGQAGDAVVALAYAREFDPKTFTPGGCIKAADAETAAYWYEIAVSKDGTNPEPKQRLEELQK